MLPDVTVFGPYTYLLTEILWGAVALGLLVYADAFRVAARTLVVLYPLGYAWDWYSLEVGIFEIPARTGHELLGIPIEEHLFIVVVVAAVVGAHESLRKLDRRGALPAIASIDRATGPESTERDP